MSSSGSIYDVAITGMAGRFPGAANLDEYWRNLRDGKESTTFFSEEELEAAGVDPVLLRDPRYVKASPLFPDDPGLFDAAFFGFSPREAEIMDPQHRILLECAWEALEDAGYDPERFDGRIGVYAGSTLSSYLLVNLLSNPELLESAGGFQTLIRNDKDYLTTNISYKLNLRGPSIAVQTACSTSLVAVHLACQSLINRECDLALVGGVRIVSPQKSGYLHEPGGVFSPDGHCRPFDRQAEGTIFGSGAGMVVLRRLDDAVAGRDEIHAVVKGSAINNDGASKVGFTAPGFEGQTQVIAEALSMAGVEPDTIGYVETHGTGTPLGDPIEVAALARVFGAKNGARKSCALGSVKSNIGHLEAAAGIASVIKTVLALKHACIPPSPNYREPNPQIDFANGPFYVNAAPAPFTGKPRRAGVSSFGIGGTNAHVVLEQAPQAVSSASARSTHLILLSAKTPAALENATARMVDFLGDGRGIDLADAAFTTQVGRRAFAYRRVVVASDRADLRTQFTSTGETRERPVVFLFPGQGAQYAGMGAELLATEAVFREQIDRCATLLIPLLGGVDLRAKALDLTPTALAQPSLFMVEYALARQLMEYGIQPQAMLGHSIGEYVAACLAGVFTLEDALALVAERGRLMQGVPAGAMLAICLPEGEAAAQLPPGVALAAVNAPALVTAAGPVHAIEALAAKLTARGIESRRLQTSHAFHSAMMDAILSPFEQRVRRTTLYPPGIPYVSNVTGTWVTAAQATDPAYWATHLRSTVRFSDGLRTALSQPESSLLEVGPGQTLATCARQHPNAAGHSILTSMRRAATTESDLSVLLTALGRLWLAGAPVDWEAFQKVEKRRRVPLPTYPFERRRYWIESRGFGLKAPAQRTASVDEPQPQTGEQTGYEAPEGELEREIARVWQDLLGVQRIGRRDNFFELGGHSLLLISMRSRLQEALRIEMKPHWLVEAPTIAQLAACVASESSGSAYSPLVAIQSRGSRTPLFCVHPNAAKLPGFVELSRYLGADQPFFGLQGPSLDDSSDPSVEAMAARNIEAMRTVQPHGPYLLSGYSFGGIVAFEMARQLEGAGDPVALLALLDSVPFPSDVAAFGTADDVLLLAWFAWELSRSSRVAFSLDFDRLRSLPPDRQLPYILEQAGFPQLAASPSAVADVTGLFQLFRANVNALWKYQPGRYGRSLTVFKAREAPAGNLLQAMPPLFLKHFLTAYLADPTFGWGALTAVRPAVHSTGGNHYTMLTGSHARHLAVQIQTAIRNAQPLSETTKSSHMPPNPLIGAWKLVSWELRTAQDELLLYPFGQAVGYLLYSDNGYMSLSIMKVNRPNSGLDNPLAAGSDDNAAAAEGYFSYCGRYEVRDGKVIHHIEAGLFPDWVGKSQERPYQLSDNQLALLAPSPVGGVELVNRLVWERAG